MNQKSKGFAFAAAVLLGLSVIGLAASEMKSSKKDVVWPASAIQWNEGPMKGVKMAPLWGDMNKGGEYAVLVKFEPGIMHPLHWHTESLKLVVISGTFVHKGEGGSETKLGPGSYLMQAGGVKHVSGCAAGAECQFFMTSGESFDMMNVEQASSPGK